MNEQIAVPGEAGPLTYPHQMRGPQYRWWRPILALALMVVAMVLCLVATGVPLTLLGVAPAADDLFSTPYGTLVGDLAISLVLVATLVGLWLGFRRSPWRVFSVQGRMRWGWLLRCLLLTVPVWVPYLAVTWFVTGQEVTGRASGWVSLIAISLLATPLQSAAEEVFFRGGLVQTVGAWFATPWVALLVTTLVSTAGFGLAHGSLDAWIIADLSALAVVGCYLAWRTGGLEAAIALHVVNNVLISVGIALLGGADDAYVDTTSTGDPVSALVTWVATLVAGALILWQAQRLDIAKPGWLTPATG